MTPKGSQKGFQDAKIKSKTLLFAQIVSESPSFFPMGF